MGHGASHSVDDVGPDCWFSAVPRGMCMCKSACESGRTCPGLQGYLFIPTVVREWVTLLSGSHRLFWQGDGPNENVRCDTYVRYVYDIAVVLSLLPSTTVSAVMRSLYTYCKYPVTFDCGKVDRAYRRQQLLPIADIKATYGRCNPTLDSWAAVLCGAAKYASTTHTNGNKKTSIARRCPLDRAAARSPPLLTIQYCNTNTKRGFYSRPWWYDVPQQAGVSICQYLATRYIRTNCVGFGILVQNHTHTESRNVGYIALPRTNNYKYTYIARLCPLARSIAPSLLLMALTAV